MESTCLPFFMWFWCHRRIKSFQILFRFHYITCHLIPLYFIRTNSVLSLYSELNLFYLYISSIKVHSALLLFHYLPTQIINCSSTIIFSPYRALPDALPIDAEPPVTQYSVGKWLLATHFECFRLQLTHNGAILMTLVNINLLLVSFTILVCEKVLPLTPKALKISPVK